MLGWTLVSLRPWGVMSRDSSPQFASSEPCSSYKIEIKKYFLQALSSNFIVALLKEIQCSAILLLSLVHTVILKLLILKGKFCATQACHFFLSFLLPAGSTVGVITLCISS